MHQVFEEKDKMKINKENFNEINRPIYILEEDRLRKNLQLIHEVACKADIEIILAFKAYALWKTFPIFKEYIHATTASSLYEAKLAFQEFGAKAHTYSPAYTSYEIEEIARCSSHLTFNSLTQYESYKHVAKKYGVSIGVRINPEYSEVETDLYNPCAPGTRFGIVAADLPATLPSDIEGLHCHCHCESSSSEFKRTLEHVEKKFSSWLSQVKWINFGGGHLMTRADYDTNELISLLTDFKSRHPHLKVILEPGSAFAWQTGPLVAQVVDIVENQGIKTAIVNASFTCHMPDCLEMPYHPRIRNAQHIENNDTQEGYIYRIGGNSCLSGDYMGNWLFKKPLEINENIIFEDMLHYTTVKTNMFNGISHPSIGLLHSDGNIEVLREYTYEDYKARMD